MQVTKIGYSRVYSLGNYENEKIMMEATVGEGEDLTQAYVELKTTVEHAHDLRNDLCKRDESEEIVRNAKNYRGYEVDQARAFLNGFAQKYPNLVTDQALLPASQVTSPERTAEHDAYDEYEDETRRH
jgi:hypothetical protein